MNGKLDYYYFSEERAKKSKGSKETKNIKEREREREKACQRTTGRRLFVSSHAKLGDLTDTTKTLQIGRAHV